MKEAPPTSSEAYAHMAKHPRGEAFLATASPRSCSRSQWRQQHGDCAGDLGWTARSKDFGGSAGEGFQTSHRQLGQGSALDIPCSYRDRSMTVAAQNVG